MEKKNTKFVFFGTPQFAVLVLEELENKGFLPALVITAPDRPVGRGLKLTPPPVKLWAEKRGIPVLQPDKLEAKSLKLEAYAPELFIVASYGKILPKWLLEIPENGTLNVHPSLLPKLRGASPIESAILSENETGVTIMLMDEQMDHGPIVSQKEIRLPYWPVRASELEIILAKEGGKLLTEAILQWLSGKIIPREQEHEKATFTKKIRKEDGLIELSGEPEKNLRKILAYEKWPGAYFFFDQSGNKIRVKIKEARINDGLLELVKVVPEGKKEMSWQDFLRGYGKPSR